MSNLLNFRFKSLKQKKQPIHTPLTVFIRFEIHEPLKMYKDLNLYI